VAAELALLARAIDEDIPVLGLCFGGQALAAVLGGTVEPAPTPELGWTEIETDEPELVPPGPWLEWHYDRFSTPPGATEIARTGAATQAFRHGRHLGVQFHPETTVEIVADWAASDHERVAALGHADADKLIAATPEQREAARAAAFALFDGFLARANDAAAATAAVRRG
jgi:GMP synthase-like glutamine amidotransferase